MAVADAVSFWARNPLAVLACCFALAAQQAGSDGAAHQRGRITGTVIEGTTGAPIEGARITLGAQVFPPMA